MVIAGCQPTEPPFDAAAACARLDLAAVRDSVRALPGWTATTNGKVTEGAQTRVDQTRIVRFVAPDQMLIEWRGRDGITSREWYLGARAWLDKQPGMPEQYGVAFPEANRIRASAMPPIDSGIPGKFVAVGTDGPCVLASQDGRNQVFASVGGVYAGERNEPTSDGQQGLVTVSFDPSVPSIPAPPT